MNEDVECPYCGKYNEINHEDGYGYEEDTYHEEECVHCEKIYQYTTTTSYRYDVYQAPCLNDGDHDFEKALGGCSDPEYFKNRYKCQCCEKEVKVVPSCENCVGNGGIGYTCLIRSTCCPDFSVFNNWKLNINSINRRKNALQ